MWKIKDIIYTCIKLWNTYLCIYACKMSWSFMISLCRSYLTSVMIQENVVVFEHLYNEVTWTFAKDGIHDLCHFKVTKKLYMSSAKSMFISFGASSSYDCFEIRLAFILTSSNTYLSMCQSHISWNTNLDIWNLKY